MFNFNLNKLKACNTTKSLDIESYKNQKKDKSKEYLDEEKIKALSYKFEKALDDLLTQKINLQTCCENLIFKNNENNNKSNTIYNYFNPNFVVFSETNKTLYILFPRKGKDKIIYQFFCLFESSEKIEINEFYLKFISKNNDKNNKDYNTGVNFNNQAKNNKNINIEEDFFIKGIILHPKNQNQLCFFSSDKIAFIKNLAKLKNHKNLEEIECFFTNQLNKSLINASKNVNNNEKDNRKIFYKKIKFSDFDNYYGTLTSDNILNIYSLKNELAEVTINLEDNISDFDFGKVNKVELWEAFSIFFLKENGEINYCCPVFPKKFNIDILDDLNKVEILNEEYLNKNKINVNDSINTSNIILNKNDLNEESQIKLNKIENDDNYIINNNSSNDLENKIIENLKKCTYTKENHKKHFKDYNINRDLDYNKTQSKKIIEINDFLRNFNNNIIIKSLIITDKRNKILLEESLNNQKSYYSNNYANKFTQIHIISVYPFTIMRVYENYTLEIISLINEIKPNNNVNKFFKEELNAVLLESIKFNRYADIEKSDLKIVKNKNNPRKILINNINDIYLLNLKFAKNINLNNANDLLNNNNDKFLETDIQQIIKLNYLKNRNVNNLNLCYLGIDFITFTNNHIYNKNFIKNYEFILTINTDSSNKFSSHFHIKCKNNKTKRNLIIKNKTFNSSKDDFNSFRRIKNNIDKMTNYKNSMDYFSKIEELYKKFIVEEFPSSEIKDLDNFKKPLLIDREILKKIMEHGMSNKIEGLFYYIFNYYNRFFSNKCFYLQNKMNLLVEFYQKLELFKITDKKANLKKINMNIDNILKIIEQKKGIIIAKIKNVSVKISKICLTQQNFNLNYANFKDNLLVDMENNVKMMKNCFIDLKNKFKNIDYLSKNLVFIKNKFNSDYLVEENKNKMVLFTEYFLNFYKLVDELNDFII